MIPVKCFNCDTLHFENKCPKCRDSGGYPQVVKNKTIECKLYFLEQRLTHSATKNVYQIKEFQSGGMLVVVKFSHANALLNKRSYIKNESLGEYK
jgi:phage regulator Rha-like protein